MTDGDGYYEQATSWALDSRAREFRSLRLAWIAAGIAAGIAMLEAVAIMLMMPLKTVEPITVLVDRQTGFVQALDPVAPRRIQADAALTDAMLAQYVSARETFDRATIANDYRRVALWSTGLARSQYISSIPASNPESPLQRYPFGTTVATRVKSISPLSPGTALVRFDTQLADRSGHIALARPWVAVIRYRYSNAPMSFDNRLANPLGFQVSAYRRDAEAPVLPERRETAPSATITQPIAVRDDRMTTPRVAGPSVLSRLAGRGLLPSQIPMGSPLAASAGSPIALAQR